MKTLQLPLQAVDRIVEMVIDRPFFVASLKQYGLSVDEIEIASLKQYGLSVDEIEICCLILMGFPIKCLAVEFRDPGIYRRTSLIRKKLGICQAVSLKEMLSVIYEDR